MKTESEPGPRVYESKDRAETEFAILPGENPLEFELLRTQLAEQYLPDGPIEEDLVLTIAKCISRKRRFQRFIAAKASAARADPEHDAHDPVLALTATYHRLADEKDEYKVRLALVQLGYFGRRLLEDCPQHQFPTTEDWVKAVLHQIENVWIPEVTRFGPPPDEVLMKGSAAVLTDELFALELQFEERIDAMMERALDRLAKEKARKHQITLGEVRRFGKSHPVRLVGLEKRRRPYAPGDSKS
jgi:hypothetical protein